MVVKLTGKENGVSGIKQAAENETAIQNTDKSASSTQQLKVGQKRMLADMNDENGSSQVLAPIFISHIAGS